MTTYTPDEIRSAFQTEDLQTAVLIEIAAQLSQLNANLRDIHPELNLPEECRKHECTYYRHYLAYGPADLEHEGFHAAEKLCGEWQKRASDWLDAHKDDNKEMPQSLVQACEAAERRVRA